MCFYVKNELYSYNIYSIKNLSINQNICIMRKITFQSTLFCLFFISSTYLQAQTPTYLSQFGSQGSGNGQFEFLEEVEVHPITGDIWVSDKNNSRIQIFNSSGVYQSQFGTSGSGNGQFNTPRDIAFDASGNAYIVDIANHRVQKFNSSGVYQSQFGSNGTGNGQLQFPEGIAVHPTTGDIWVVDKNNDRVQIFNSSGVYQSQFGSAGAGNGQFGIPIEIDFDALGNAYVVDVSNHIVQKFNSSGVFQSQFGSNGTGNGQFQFPEGVKVHPNGDIWVADKNNRRVQIFNSSGVYQTQFGTLGTGNGQFSSGGLVDISFDAAGDAYIVDRSNHRVQKFDVNYTPPDIAAPIFESSTPSSSIVTGTTFTLATDIDEAGIIYYVVVADGASAPSSAQVKLGTDASNATPVANASQVVNSGGFTHDFSITGLTAGTAYDVYVVAEDDEGTPNLQASPVKIDVMTIAVPTVAFDTTSSSGAESVSSANLAVILSAISSQTVTVGYSVTGGTATGSGTDYTLADGTLTFIAGDTSENITISSIVADAILESNETVTVTISSPTNATLGTNTIHTYTIINDDAAAVTIADVSGNENDGAITVTATLDNAVQGGFTVDVSTLDGTATTGDSDYSAVTNQTLTFSGTASETQTFTIIPTGDTKLEANETLTLSQSNLAATILSVTITDGATVTIDNDDFVATVGTDDASLVTSNSVVLGGNVTSEGSSSVTDKGIVYAITTGNANPQIGGANVITDGNGTGSGIFSETISSLVANTQYSYVAYAINSSGITYGAVKTFTTATLGLEEVILDESLKLYPNPVDNVLHIKTNNLEIQSVTLYDVLGKSVKNITEENNAIHFSGLNKGVYLLKIKTEQGTAVRRIVKK